MKRLFLISLLFLLILLLSSCFTSQSDQTLALASGMDLQDRIALYEEEAAKTGDFKLYYNLAYSYIQAGKLEDAARVAEDALILFPDSYRMLSLKAYAARENGNLAGYEDALLQILKQVPADIEKRKLLMDLYFKTGFTKKAEDQAYMILYYDAKDEDALFILSFKDGFYSLLGPGKEIRRLLDAEIMLPEKLFETEIEKRRAFKAPII